MSDSPPAKDQKFIRSRGMKFPDDPSILRGRLRKMLRQNDYETKETQAVLRVVREGDRVIELGAGVGYMSTLVASKRKVASVHSFEANPNLIPYIRRVYAANGLDNAEVTNAILGARTGRVDFHVRADILSSSMTRFDGEEPPQTHQIDVLDAGAVFADLKPNVLICDIEGAEVDLIPALDLSGLRAAVIELHPQWIGPEGVNKVFAAFMSAGLAYYHRGSQNKVVSFRREW
ncbi:FkbM family methyltransferase [Sulfitobacter sp. S0837]|uniref:FkbM family methyltransferase n=1 Tax=Sulfitobacter maritimus TaxID=2741719 RepID=UPI00158349C0|nr:FkbM family methyltransferase [Sulfitobacter maritimus]NUH64508.1 FkbM family methyltransferase [Sulfitobacter maritimus]